MTWLAFRQYTNQQLDEFALDMLRAEVPVQLEFFRQRGLIPIGQLASWYSRMLIARGSAFVCRELAPIGAMLAPSVAAYLREYAVGNDSLSSAVLPYASVTNLFEIVDYRIEASVMQSFRPVVLRVETDRQDAPVDHWTKALLALVVDQRIGWSTNVDLMRAMEVPFIRGAVFGPNMQGLLDHLAGALRIGASLEDVLPAWHAFMAAATSLMNTWQITEEVILWVARIVFHHIGREPLGKVGDRVYEAVDRLVAAGL